MPKVGEAWYDLNVRDEKLVAGFSGAERRARSSGKQVEGAFGEPAQKAIDNTTKSATRFGGVMGKLPVPTQRFGGVMSNLGMGVMQGVGIAGFMGATAAAGAFVEGIGRSITAASDLNETLSKSRVVFRGHADEVIAWSENSAEAMGMSQNAALGAAATYGNLFVSLGLAEEQAGSMSTSLVGLAGDLASFNNVDPTEALDALRSGLVGETEPLRRFGVNLNEATLSQKAMEMGLISTTKGTLPAAAKAQAAYALILEQTKTAQGDFARTSDGLANRQRIAAAKVEDAFASMGQAILPLAAEIVPVVTDAFVGLINVIGGVIKWIQNFIGENKVLFDLLGLVARVAIGALILAFSTLANIVSSVFGVIGQVLTGIVTFIRPAIETFIGLVQNVIDVAAQIPGPWQDTAKSMSMTLGQMKREVSDWGTSTVQTATTTGATVPGAVAGPIAAGAPQVATAAATGITDPIVTATSGAAVAAGKEAAATPAEIAKSLQDGQFDVKTAIDSLKDVQKNSLSKTKEIAKLEAFLTGDALAKALKSKKPAVRAEADAWKAAAEERLWALKNGVPELARKTGISYADALEKKKKEVAAAAAAHTKAVRQKYVDFEEGVDAWGRKTGRSYADGIYNSTGWLKHQVDAYLNVAKARLKALSPPEEGPLKEIDRWGEKLGQTYADAFAKSSNYFGFRAEEFTMPARSVLAPTAVASIAPGASAAPAPAAGAPITISPVYAPLIGTATTAQLQEAARVLTTSIAREMGARGLLPRTPGLSY